MIRLHTIFLLILVIGCQKNGNKIIEKSLVSDYSIKSCKPIENIIFDKNGVLLSSTQKNQISKWKIHSNTSLKKVAQLTSKFEDRHCIELHTINGKYMILAPAYGQRRIPGPGISLDYKISLNNNRAYIEKNGVKVDQNLQIDSAIKYFFTDISNESNIGFVNLYIEFPDKAIWEQAEKIIDSILKPIDSMRGLWLGISRKDKITLHFHDIWKNGWSKGTTYPKLKELKKSDKASKKIFSDDDQFDF